MTVQQFTDKQVIAAVKRGISNGLSAARIAEGLGYSSSSGLRGRYNRLRKSDPSLPKLLPNEAHAARKTEADAKALRGQVTKLEAELREHRKQADKMGLIKSLIHDSTIIPRDPPAWLTEHSTKRSAWHHGTPTLLLSDLHWGERVFAKQVNGVNQFDLDIARDRLKRVVETSMSLLFDVLSNPDYDGIILAMGGDMVSGNIHEELRETNAAPINVVVLDLLDNLVAAVDTLLTKFKRVFIPCVTGNHGRLDKRPRAKNAVYDNFEWTLYQLLARHYADDQRVTVVVSDASDLVYRVHNCVAVGTKVLTHDLRWVNAEDLRAGDALLGFDEELPEGIGRGRTRRWRRSEVVGCHVEKRESVRLHLANGETLTCTRDHPLLCGTTCGNQTQWVKAADIKPGWRLKKYLDVWEAGESRDHGWLAGILDGEGCLATHGERRATSLNVSQNPGLVCDKIGLLMSRFGVSFAVDDSKKCRRRTVRGGLREQLRLLGTVRPERLIGKWKNVVENGGASMEAFEAVEVLSVEEIGLADIVVMGTTTETYLSNGYGSHNTRYLLTHGDQFHGGSGISGPLVPWSLGNARKHKRQAAIGQPYDTMIFGHWHSLAWGPGDSFICNGSLKGYDEYAFRSNFGFEPPQQALWVTHPKHGITFRMGVQADARPEPKAAEWVAVQRMAEGKR